MDVACKKFLSKNPELQFISDTEKIRCSLSGHEMPCRIDVLKSYVSGKKFTKLKAHHEFNFSRLEPFLIPSKKRKYQLFCALTNRYVNRKPDEVKGHISGRRYKQAMERYNAGEVILFQEKLRASQAMNANSSEEEKMETQSEQQTPDHRMSSQGVSESGFWIPPDSDSDGEADQMKPEEEASYQAGEEAVIKERGSSSSKKGRKRKGLTHTLVTVKKQKRQRSFDPETQSSSKKIKKTRTE